MVFQFNRIFDHSCCFSPALLASSTAASTTLWNNRSQAAASPSSRCIKSPNRTPSPEQLLGANSGHSPTTWRSSGYSRSVLGTEGMRWPRPRPPPHFLNAPLCNLTPRAHFRTSRTSEKLLRLPGTSKWAQPLLLLVDAASWLTSYSPKISV
jgi:hypothetical protein